MGSASLHSIALFHNQWGRPVFHSTALLIANGVGQSFTLLLYFILQGKHSGHCSSFSHGIWAVKFWLAEAAWGIDSLKTSLEYDWLLKSQWSLQFKFLKKRHVQWGDDLSLVILAKYTHNWSVKPSQQHRSCPGKFVRNGTIKKDCDRQSTLLGACRQYLNCNHVLPLSHT